MLEQVKVQEKAAEVGLEQILENLEKLVLLCEALGDQRAQEILKRFSESHPAEFAQWLASNPQLNSKLNKFLYSEDAQN